MLRITLGDEWPSLDEQRVWRAASIKAGYLTAATRALIDVRALKTFPKFAELNQIIAAAIRDGGLPLHRAYLATEGLQFGVARQIQMLAPESMAVQVFTDQREAEAWLAGDRSPGAT